MTRRAWFLIIAIGGFIGLPGGAYIVHTLMTGTPEERNFIGNMLLVIVMLTAAGLIVLQAYHQNRRG